jgi:hypothetical protein
MNNLVNSNHQNLPHRSLNEIHESCFRIWWSDIGIAINNRSLTWLRHLRRAADILGPQIDWDVSIFKEVRPEQQVEGNKPLEQREVAEEEQRDETDRVDKAMLGSNLWIVMFNHRLRMALEDPIHKEMNENEDSKNTS